MPSAAGSVFPHKKGAIVLSYFIEGLPFSKGYLGLQLLFVAYSQDQRARHLKKLF